MTEFLHISVESANRMWTKKMYHRPLTEIEKNIQRIQCECMMNAINRTSIFPNYLADGYSDFWRKYLGLCP